jgi:CubicO group peptidase (beta-lactamase class C family)
MRTYVLLILCLCWFKSFSQQTKSFDGLLNYCRSDFHFNGIVLVTKENKILYKNEFGKADEANNINNTADTKFRLGSLSKQFTAFIIIKLAEEKYISLDDPLSKFIKEFDQPGKKEIKIRNLLNHTSGLADYTALKNFDDRKLYSKDSITQMIADAPLGFTPSSSYAYSNSNYFLLAVIAEHATGKRFKDLLNEIIFSKANMHNSREDVDDKPANAAKGYVYKNDSVTQAPFIEMKNTEGGGGIYSTGNDLLKWSLYFQKQLATDNFLKQTFQPSTLPGSSQNIYFGGWCFFPELIFHEGHVNGFANLLAMDTVRHQTVIILSNHDYKQLYVTMRSLYNIANNNVDAIEWIKNSPAKNLKQYNGDYSVGDLTVSIKDSANYLRGTAFGNTKLLQRYKDDEFFFLGLEGFVRFERGNNGNVIALNSFQDYSWVRLVKK